MQVFEDFKFNKNFGQNFISDKNLLNAIVLDSGISFACEVLEIGTGAGTLTEAISNHAKKVVSFEIDKKLTEFLAEKFENVPNVQVVMADALKLPIGEIEKCFEGDYHIIANLPYYITTPLIFKFLEETNKARSITIMVQKEVAQKIVAKPGEDNYGILSVMLQFYCDCKITRIVKKQMFTPRPKVDSAVIRLVRKENVQFDKDFSNFVSKIFAMKRKTLYNNLLQAGFEKDYILETLKNNLLREDVRAEKLTLSQIRQLYLSLNKIV